MSLLALGSTLVPAFPPADAGSGMVRDPLADHSGGTAPDSHRLPRSAVAYSAHRDTCGARARSPTGRPPGPPAAGFADVEVTPLTELYELDGVHGVAADHRRTLQHLITARNPETDAPRSEDRA